MQTAAARHPLLTGSPFRQYVSAYPHKTAYRPLPSRRLGEVWTPAAKRDVQLYVHVPFCEMRCGFCNLFTTANPAADAVETHLQAFERQLAVTAEECGPMEFTRAAVGGGTPTFLSAARLDWLFDRLRHRLGFDASAVPTSVETSPATATADRLRVLRDAGVDRVSLGVQNFHASGLRALGRPQPAREAFAAWDRLRAAGFSTLNVDLIYGAAGQSADDWLDSVNTAVRLGAEEVFLYPLYVRPLTGLGDTAADADPTGERRLSLYRVGRDALRDAGYEQVSLRMFRAPHAPASGRPVYCVQEDTMLGVGCGARSYTPALHSSGRYAVAKENVRAILAEYAGRSGDGFRAVDYGFELSGDEQRRRYVLQNLLTTAGLSLAGYRERFGSDAAADLPALEELVALDLAAWVGDSRLGASRLVPTELGLERADAVGPMLYSEAVRERMDQWRTV